MKEYEDFDEWFDHFTMELEQKGYKGPVDKYSFEWNWEDEQSPEYAAYEFLKEINHARV